MSDHPERSLPCEGIVPTRWGARPSLASPIPGAAFSGLRAACSLVVAAALTGAPASLVGASAAATGAPPTLMSPPATVTGASATLASGSAWLTDAPASVMGASAPLAEPTAPSGPPTPHALHTYLEASTPADGTTVEEDVERVVFRFNTPVQLPLSAVTIRDGDGREVAHEGVQPVPEEDDHHFQVRFPEPLAPGSYSVQWQTAGPDDHVVRDAFAFAVADPGVDEPPEDDPPEPTPAPTPAEVEPDVAEWTDPTDQPLGILIRWIHLIALVGMIGVVAFRILVLPTLARTEGQGGFGEAARRRLVGAGWALAVLFLAALPLRLWLQSASIFGPEALRGGNLATVVFETAWGSGFLISLLAVLVFGTGLVVGRANGERGAGWALMGLAVLLLPLASGLSGHAWAAEEPRLLSVGSLYVHVLSAGVWMGGLGAMLLVGIPALQVVRRERAESAGAKEEKTVLPGLGTLVAAFSRMALVAVGLLILAGLTQAWIHVGTAGNLVGSGYGRTLLVKLLLAAGAFALGFYNWRVVRPALRERPVAGMIRIPATVELLLGAVVLLVTAVLVVQALP